MVCRDIPNKDKMARHFKNLRLEISASPCIISKVVLKDIEDKTAGLFKNLRLEIFASPCINHRQSSDISKMKTRKTGSLST